MNAINTIDVNVKNKSVKIIVSKDKDLDDMIYGVDYKKHSTK